MVGIFTERDALLRLNTDAARYAARPVRDFMTKSPDTIESDAPIAFALHKMDVGGYRHIPIMSGGKVTGIISVRDILRYITEDLMSLATER
jgi:CBS domain-containing protein